MFSPKGSPRCSEYIPEDPLNFLNFPALTYLGEDEEMVMAQWLSQLKQDHTITSNCLDENIEGSVMVSEKDAAEKQKHPLVSKKRSNTAGKKDRHSKVYTAQGPRDRRMRLSLQIARRFFDLQDMLGFDKASKTIDWLLVKSRSAIKELVRSDNEPNMKSLIQDTFKQKFMMEIGEQPSNTTEHQEKKVRKRSRKAVPIFLNKESRDKARARARARTMEKMKTKVLQENPRGSPSNLEGKICENAMEFRNQDMTYSQMAVADQLVDPINLIVGSQPRLLS